MKLSDVEEAMLHGAVSPGAAMAMKVLVAFSDAVGAGSLLPIAGAHVDGCLYHGEASLDFAEALLRGAARVAVPTTLNVGSIDLIHPELMRLSGDRQLRARRLMAAHEELGCIPSFTCAPYQTLFRPSFGDQIAWGESNAIVFANSVIGARTERYGDFLDLCCAITGRAPAQGLHLDGNRRGRVLFRLKGFPDAIRAADSLFVAVGMIVGHRCRELVPVIEGLPHPRDEDQLKALGAAAATFGAVGLFHAVGITPEAPSRAAALHGGTPEATLDVTPDDIRDALGRLSMVPEGSPISALCLGTPHFSQTEWHRLAQLLRQSRPKPGLPIYVNTARATLEAIRAEGLLDELAAFGVTPVVDTCTYVTAIVRELDGAIMTNSGKWAHYAPGNIGCRVAFGELEDCIASASAGLIVRGSG
jgi:predicted aconitase